MPKPKDGIARYRPEKGVFRALIAKDGKILALFHTPPTDEQGHAMAAALSDQQPEALTREIRAQGVDLFGKMNQEMAVHFAERGVTDGSVERRNLTAYDAFDFAGRIRSGEIS